MKAKQSRVFQARLQQILLLVKRTIFTSEELIEHIRKHWIQFFKMIRIFILLVLLLLSWWEHFLVPSKKSTYPNIFFPIPDVKFGSEPCSTRGNPRSFPPDPKTIFGRDIPPLYATKLCSNIRNFNTRN